MTEHHIRSSFQTVLFNTGWLTFARVAGDLAGVLLFIGISRNLGLAGIGQYSYAFAVAAIAAAGVGVGLEEYGLREYSRLDPQRRREMFSRIMGLQLFLLFAVVLVLASFLMFSGSTVGGMVVILPIAIHVLTFQFAVMFFIPAYASQSMFMPAVAELIFRVGGIGFAILLVTTFNSTLAVAATPLALGTTLLMIVAILSARHHNGPLKLSMGPRDAIATLVDTWPFALSTVIYNLYNRLGTIMLAIFLGEQVTGIYATALKIYEFGLMPLYLLGVAVFPSLSRAFGLVEGDLYTTADKFLRTTLVVVSLVAWGIVFAAPLVVVPLLGEEFEAAKLATKFIAIIAFLAALDLWSMRLMLAMHLQRKRVKIQAVAVVVNFGLNLVLIPWMGVYGAIAAMAMTQSLMISCYFYYFLKNENTRSLMWTLFKYCAIAVLVIGITGLSIHSGLIESVAGMLGLVLLISAVWGTGFVPCPRKFLRRPV